MGLDSYLELFTTMVGWTIANLIFSVLLDTGIVFIPLIVTIVAVWMEAHVEGTENGAAEWAIRKMEIELGAALFVMALCFVPTTLTTLDRAHLSYKPSGNVLTPSPPAITGGASGTTYDAAFGAAGDGTPVPLWWYTAMGLSSGVNAAVRAGVGNTFLGLRQAEEMARLATIESPALRSESQAFRNQCFVPAHAKFHGPNAPSSEIAASVAANPLYGKDDTEWIGSRTFTEDPEFYASFRAQQTVAGFPLDLAGDDKDAAPGASGDSMPNCKRWWTEPTIGLRARLMDQGGDRLQRAADYAWGILNAAGSGLMPGAPMNLDYVKDQILKQALWRSQANFMQTDQVLGGRNASRWELPEFLSGLGIIDKGAEASFSYYPVVQFLTLSQPFILMALYIFLPLIVVFSRFNLAFMMYGALAIFTVKFWAAMWTIARYADERMVAAMYGDNTMLLREYLTNGLDGGAKRAILNVVTLSLFIGLPLVWSGMMAWIGLRVGSAVEAAVLSAYGAGTQAGESAKRTTGSLVASAARGLGRSK
ncbi:MAG TPA: conjugal transfer protein TraG N-terminal domain-containing protein [Aquabacterium sp.]|nr:conjugal transfer protein TraG N-terminal domain-containing protein [Aquabacterium sp.]